MDVEICIGPELRKLIPRGWGLHVGTGTTRELDGTLCSAKAWIELIPKFETVATIEDAPAEEPTVTVSAASEA